MSKRFNKPRHLPRPNYRPYVTTQRGDHLPNRQLKGNWFKRNWQKLALASGIGLGSLAAYIYTRKPKTHGPDLESFEEQKSQIQSIPAGVGELTNAFTQSSELVLKSLVPDSVEVPAPPDVRAVLTNVIDIGQDKTYDIDLGRAVRQKSQGIVNVGKSLFGKAKRLFAQEPGEDVTMPDLDLSTLNLAGLQDVGYSSDVEPSKIYVHHPRKRQLKKK